ncbi:MAG: acyl-CoA thioester [Planctomycetota bacterium]|nr:MAG: acyl-CoA thioester [Planctomycetota bacterium]
MSAFVHRVKPVWRDMDALRHVNNAVYLTYLENAREAWWKDVAGTYDIFPFTLVRVEIDYRSSVTWRDEIDISVTVAKIGNSSFELAYLLAAGKRVVAEARTVLVMMDEKQVKPVRIPEEARQKMKRYE